MRREERSVSSEGLARMLEGLGVMTRLNSAMGGRVGRREDKLGAWKKGNR